MLQVAGKWDAVQSNEFVATFDIVQVGTQIDGGTRCTHSNESVRSVAASGKIQNDHFDFTVTWDNDTEGHYTGFLRRSGPDKGHITGDTVDTMNEGSHATWRSSRNFPLTV